MSDTLRKTAVNSTTLGKFPGLFHAVFIGPRVRIDPLLGSHQPAYRLVSGAIRSSGYHAVRVAMNELVHSAVVTRASTAPYVPRRADGLVSHQPGTYLAVSTADCVPVLAFDPVSRVVGIAHAGWKGTVSGIARRLVISMVREGARIRDIRVWLGPSAKSCCYEVRSNDAYRVRRFIAVFGRSVIVTRGARSYIDLHRAIEHELRNAGVGERSIETSATCTIHDGRLPSHRRERMSRTTTMYSVVGLVDPLDSLRGKKVLVMGLGLHGGGVDTTRWMAAQGARVVVTDLQSKKALAEPLKKLHGLNVTYVLGRHRYRDVAWADLIVASPGVPRESPYLRFARRRSKPVENDASIFFSRYSGNTVGITGTKGKTTVAVLTAAMLRKNRKRVVAVGHHQVPLLSFLSQISSQSIVVAELSSWRLERMAARAQSPHVAVITNVMPDHLNRYGSFASYILAKRSILDHQHPDDHAVINRDDNVSRSLGRYVRSHRWWFSVHPFNDENGTFIRNGTVYIREQGVLHRVGALPPGKWGSDHQRQDLLAATLAAWLSGASIQSIQAVMASVPIIPHRMELVRVLNGVRYVNDSAATTPEAARAALAATEGPVVLIAGGSDKRLNYRSFAHTINRRCKNVVLLSGTATTKILRNTAGRKKVDVVGSMDDAVSTARSHASSGTTVLLSPGAASFGLFKHEFDRGDQFRTSVQSLRR